ncbi:MAG: hypothetical protein AB7G39_10875 [Alphaproteobacteria bacterium]
MSFKHTPDRSDGPAAERRRIMREALATHRRQQTVLEQLDPETQARLRRLASRVFAIDPDDRGPGETN